MRIKRHRYSSKTKPYKKYKRARRNNYAPLRYLRTSPAKVNIVRSFTQSLALTGDQTTPTGGVLAFHLNDVPDFTELTSLYQQYRLNGVKAEWFPEFNQFNPSGANPIPLPTLHLAWDYGLNSNVAQTNSVNTMEQLKTYKRNVLTRKIKTFGRPYLVGEAEEESTPTQVGAMCFRKFFLRTVFPGVSYGSLRYYFTAPDNVDYKHDYSTSVKLTYYFTFRYVH